MLYVEGGMGRMRLPWDHPDSVDSHDGKYHRERSADLYHTARWTRLSRAYRIEHPLCEECRRKGVTTSATVVDHIVPYPICESYFFDRRNLQSLCDECNHKKGQHDKKMIQEWRKMSK